MNDFNTSIARGRTTDTGVDAGLRSFMLGVYSKLTIGIAIAGLLAFAAGTVPALRDLIFGTPLYYIVMFAPLGMFIPLFMKWFDGFIQVFTTGFLISFLIEILQYKLTERVFDIDDIFLNTLGTFIGWVIIKILYWVKNVLKARFKKR